MSKKKKTLLIILGVLVCLICIMFSKNTAFANGLTGEEGGDYLFNQYSIENYMPDSYVNTEGNWMPWNWGKAVDDGMYSMLVFLLGCVYVAIFNGFYVIGFLVQAVYSTDITEPLMDTTVKFIQNVSGFDGSFLNNGLFTQLLAIVIIIAGLYYGFLMLKKETGRTIGGMAVFCLLIVVSLGFFWKADTFISGMNNIANSIQSVVVRAGTNALGMDNDPAIAVREGFFDVTVYKPYLLLQYNDTSIPKEKVEEILSLESGSEEREELVKKEVEENGNTMMNGWQGFKLRFLILLPMVVSSLVLAVIILIMVGMNLYHQLVFIIYCCLSPFILIMSLLPGKSQIAIRLGAKVLYELCMRTALAMLLCLMYGFSNVIYTVVGTENYMVGAVLQSIIYITIFAFRKKIYGLFVTNGQPAGRSGIGRMLGAAYLANRGMNMFKALRGNRQMPVRRSRPPVQNQSETGLSTVSRKRDLGNHEGEQENGGGLATRGFENHGVAGPGDRTRRRGVDNRLATTKKSRGSKRYRPVAPVGRTKAYFSSGSNLSGYRRNSGVSNKSERASKRVARGRVYQPVKREQVPRIKNSAFRSASRSNRSQTNDNQLQNRPVSKRDSRAEMGAKGNQDNGYALREPKLRERKNEVEVNNKSSAGGRRTPGINRNRNTERGYRKRNFKRGKKR